MFGQKHHCSAIPYKMDVKKMEQKKILGILLALFCLALCGGWTVATYSDTSTSLVSATQQI